jgi:hypothetical protein
MNWLFIRLNDGKRLIFAAALAALWVLLAGGGNAPAITTNTVWCVPNTSISPNCTSAAGKATIQLAVTAAKPGDVILVGPGYYNESVNITKANLSIFGAQAGKDAREDRHDPSKESIVDATGQGGGPGGGAAFLQNAVNTVIDGFTIEGGTDGTGLYSSGIYVNANNIRIQNNIIQNNSVGVYLYLYLYGLVQYNLFQTNNTGTPGSDDYLIPGPGLGIANDSFYPLRISENAFEGNLAAAMLNYSVGSTVISQNTSKDDGAFAVFSYSTAFFDHNQGRDFGAKGFRPVYGANNAEAAIEVISDLEPSNIYTYGNQGLQIDDNDLEKGQADGYNGIAFSNIAGLPVPNSDPAICLYCAVSNNTTKGFAGNGIVAEAPASNGALYYSMISGNQVEENGLDGILIEKATNNQYNQLFDNKAQGNKVFDCEDDTTDSLSGTPPTADTWYNNIGPLTSPKGICSQGGWWH